MASKFTERGAYEQGFADIFDREIVPHLDGLEAERLDRAAKRRFRLRVTVAATVVVAIASAVGGAVGVNWDQMSGDNFLGIVFFLIVPSIIVGGAG